MIILQRDVSIRSIIDYKLMKAGATVNTCMEGDDPEAEGELFYQLNKADGSTENFYDERELEEALDDLNDPTYRQREAEHDRYVEDIVFGPRDDT